MEFLKPKHLIGKREFELNLIRAELAKLNCGKPLKEPAIKSPKIDAISGRPSEAAF